MLGQLQQHCLPPADTTVPARPPTASLEIIAPACSTCHVSGILPLGLLGVSVADLLSWVPLRELPSASDNYNPIVGPPLGRPVSSDQVREGRKAQAHGPVPEPDAGVPHPELPRASRRPSSAPLTTQSTFSSRVHMCPQTRPVNLLRGSETLIFLRVCFLRTPTCKDPYSSLEREEWGCQS